MVEKAANKKCLRNQHKSPWTQAEWDILDPHVPAFRDADKAGRKQLLGTTVIPKMYLLHPNLDERGKTELKRKVKAWYSNNGRRKDKDRAVKLVPTRVSLGTVIASEEKEAIEGEVRRLSGAAPGSKEYLRYYRQGLKNVKERLPPEKLDQYQTATTDWEQNGYPPEVQRRNAEKKGAEFAQAVAERQFKWMGQRAITLAFNIGIEGDLGVSVFDYNDKLGDKSVPLFEKMFPAELKRFYGAVWKYAGFVHNIDKETPAPEVRIKKSKKSMLHSGLGRKGGYPIFQPVKDGSYPKLADNKDLVRIFLNQHYALALGKHTASAPFKAIGKNHLEWAEERYWPPGVQVTDPSRMNEPEIDCLLKFWRHRQDTVPPSEVFRWSHVQVGEKKSPLRSIALYPKMHSGEALQDDSNPADDPRGRKTGKKKGKGKSKQKGKKSKDIVVEPDGDDINTLLQSPGARATEGPGSMVNIDPMLETGGTYAHANQVQSFSMAQHGEAEHLATSTTHAHQTTFPPGPPNVSSLPPLNGPNDHLYMGSMGTTHLNADDPPLHEGLAYQHVSHSLNHTTQHQVQRVESAGLTAPGVNGLGHHTVTIETHPVNGLRGTEAILQPPVIQRSAGHYQSAGKHTSAGELPYSHLHGGQGEMQGNIHPPSPSFNDRETFQFSAQVIHPHNSVCVDGFNFPTAPMALPIAPADPAVLRASNYDEPNIQPGLGHPLPANPKDDSLGRDLNRPKPRPLVGPRYRHPTDEDQCFIKNRNGKRPMADITTTLPVTSRDDSPQLLNQNKRPKYQDTMDQPVEGRRIRVQVTRPGFVMDPVKKEIRPKKKKKNP